MEGCTNSKPSKSIDILKHNVKEQGPTDDENAFKRGSNVPHTKNLHS